MLILWKNCINTKLKTQLTELKRKATHNEQRKDCKLRMDGQRNKYFYTVPLNQLYLYVIACLACKEC